MRTMPCCVTPREFLPRLAGLLLLGLIPLNAHAANLTGLKINPQNPIVQVGQARQLTATGSYDDGTQQVIAQARPAVLPGPVHAHDGFRYRHHVRGHGDQYE